ncbi:MAG: DUF2865 domain-containing protein [Pseudomonadota bacterium]
MLLFRGWARRKTTAGLGVRFTAYALAVSATGVACFMAAFTLLVGIDRSIFGPPAAPVRAASVVDKPVPRAALPLPGSYAAAEVQAAKTNSGPREVVVGGYVPTSDWLNSVKSGKYFRKQRRRKTGRRGTPKRSSRRPPPFNAPRTGLLTTRPGGTFNRQRGRRRPRAFPPPQPASLNPPSYGPTYKTVCVRLCDGAYFPISFATTRARFRKDEKRCQSRCGGPAKLFYYANDGISGPKDMVDRRGRPYTALQNAFAFRASYNPACRCKPHAWHPLAKSKREMLKLQRQVYTTRRRRARRVARRAFRAQRKRYLAEARAFYREQARGTAKVDLPETPRDWSTYMATARGDTRLFAPNRQALAPEPRRDMAMRAMAATMPSTMTVMSTEVRRFLGWRVPPQRADSAAGQRALLDQRHERRPGFVPLSTARSPVLAVGVPVVPDVGSGARPAGAGRAPDARKPARVRSDPTLRDGRVIRLTVQHRGRALRPIGSSPRAGDASAPRSRQQPSMRVATAVPAPSSPAPSSDVISHAATVTAVITAAARSVVTGADGSAATPDRPALMPVPLPRLIERARPASADRPRREAEDAAAAAEAARAAQQEQQRLDWQERARAQAAARAQADEAARAAAAAAALQQRIDREAAERQRRAQLARAAARARVAAARVARARAARRARQRGRPGNRMSLGARPRSGAGPRRRTVRRWRRPDRSWRRRVFKSDN